MKCEHEGTGAAAKPSSASNAICLVGMPNSGKTTLMNAITGGHFTTANYPGVTVSLLRGRSKPEFGAPCEIVDLPGVHSTIAPSPEEELAHQVIRGQHPKVVPGAFVLVIDATQLERHLKFAGVVSRQGKPTVIALTMTDLLERTRQTVNAKALEKALGVKIVTVDPRTGGGVRELMLAIAAAPGLKAENSALAKLPEDPISAYAQIRDLLRSSGIVTRSREIDPVTARIDRIVLDKYWGFPIFFLILISLFASIFWAADPFMSWIEMGFSWLGAGSTRLLGDSLVSQFIAEGIIGGVGSVAVFFPQILILFFLMTLLEDSGYLARGAALVDRPLAWFGLHGRSFVPMLSGFACAIPAVLAARAIPSRRERFLTIWIIPLMSCSARLPVYAFCSPRFFREQHGRLDWPLPASTSQVSLSVPSLRELAVRIFSKYREPSLLAMELPAFRAPRWIPILRMTWARGSAYIKRAGVPIMTVAAILWLISHFGYSPDSVIVPSNTENSLPDSSDVRWSLRCARWAWTGASGSV